MKNAFLVITIVALFTACKGKKNADDRTMVLADTSNLGKNNASTDVSKQGKATSVNHAPVRQEPVNNTVADRPATAPVPQDKGWSEAAKGAAVGGGSGAIIGAVVNKNRPEGAIIGSVIGAGTGYAIGRSMDKKSGRVARQKARRKAKKAASN